MHHAGTRQGRPFGAALSLGERGQAALRLFLLPLGMYAWTGSCCQQYCHLLYFESFVSQPGWAHVRPSE